MSWELSAQALGAQSGLGGYGSGIIIPMTAAGAIEYVARVQAACEEAAHDLRAEVALLKLSLKALERDLAALKTPVEPNWSA